MAITPLNVLGPKQLKLAAGFLAGFAKAADHTGIAIAIDLALKATDFGEALREQDPLALALKDVSAKLEAATRKVLSGEFGADWENQSDMAATLAALPDVLDAYAPDTDAILAQNLDPERIARHAADAADAAHDDLFRRNTVGERLLVAVLRQTYAVALANKDFALQMILRGQGEALSRLDQTAARLSRLEELVSADHSAVRIGASVPDLIAIGPDVIFVGEFLGYEDSVWSLRLQHFVEGDIHTLLSSAERYEQTAVINRYILVNSLGDGRGLKGAPSVIKETAGSYLLRCPVFPRAGRIAAAELPRDYALSEAHDLMPGSGQIAEVSGVAALPQLVKTCLSHQQGESPFHRDFGTRFAEYYRLLHGSPWFEHILKLEITRQAAIPYNDPVRNMSYTPLKCVERVFGVEILVDSPTNGWLPIRVDFDVRGIGRWQRELSVCIPERPITRPSFDRLFIGPSAINNASA